MSNIPLRLKQFYAELDRFKESGEDVVADIRAEINNLELQYLKEKVFPEAVKALAEKIHGLRCEIDFSLQFDGIENIDYSLFTSSSSVLVRDSVKCTEFVFPPQTSIEPQTSVEKVKTPSPVSIIEDKITSSSPKVEVEISSTTSIPDNPVTPPLPYDLRIEEYNEYLFAIYGNTKSYSFFFQSHGGEYKTNLRGSAAWVFPKYREGEIRDYISRRLSRKIYSSGENNNLKEASVSKDHQSHIEPSATDTEEVFKKYTTLIKNLKIIGNNTTEKYANIQSVIMLLTIFEAINCGSIKENKIYFDAPLVSRYEKIWRKYIPDNLKILSNPTKAFVRSATLSFFYLVPYKTLANEDRNWTPQQVKRYVQYAKLDDQLFNIIPKRYTEIKTEITQFFFKSAKQSNGEGAANSASVSSTNNTLFDHNFNGLKRYLASLRSYEGRLYSAASISLYTGCLKSDYLSKKVMKYSSDGNIFNVKTPDDLNKLYSDVVSDIKAKIVSRTYLIALKLYIQFVEGPIVDKPVVSIKPKADKTTVPSESSSSPERKSSVARAVPHNAKLHKIITPFFSLSNDTAAKLMVDFIELVGAEKVYDLKIPYLGKYLVDTAPHPKYSTQARPVEGYWVNTCSSTAKKIEQLQKIAEKLGIEIKFVTQ